MKLAVVGQAVELNVMLIIVLLFDEAAETKSVLVLAFVLIELVVNMLLELEFRWMP